jgi:hypothetical protein
MSAYTSIRDIAKNMVSFLGYLVAEHFENLKLMPQITSPTFFIHGKADTLIPFAHSVQLE